MTLPLPHSHPGLRRADADPRALLKMRLGSARLPAPYTILILRGKATFCVAREGQVKPLYEWEEGHAWWQPLAAEVARHRLLAQALAQIQAKVEEARKS